MSTQPVGRLGPAHKPGSPRLQALSIPATSLAQRPRHGSSNHAFIGFSYRYDQLLSEILGRVHRLERTERQLLLMDPADLLEKYRIKASSTSGNKSGLLNSRGDGSTTCSSSATVLAYRYLPPLSHRKKLKIVIQQVPFTRLYGKMRRLKNFLFVR